MRDIMSQFTSGFGRSFAHEQVTGPAGSYSEEPPSVDPETARISQQTMQGMKVVHDRSCDGDSPYLLDVRFCKCWASALLIGSVTMIAQEKIMEALETDKVSVTDTYGDGRHVSIDVVSPVFDGMSSVKRQQRVYKVIKSLHGMSAEAGRPCAL